MIQLHTIGANFRLLCLGDSVSFGQGPSLIGFGFRDFVRYRWEVNLEMG